MRLINFVLINVLFISLFKLSESANDVPSWIPLEANPEVLTKYSIKLGATKGEWIDVYALDDETLTNFPQPIQALLLLFPLTENYDNFAKQRDEALAATGQEVSQNVFFLKQYIPNSGGSIGIMHALGNNRDAVKLGEHSVLDEFIKKTEGMTPEDRGKELITFNQIAVAHEEIASEGQTAPLSEDEPVTHFVALVNIDDSLYELDGRLNGPINHGQTSSEYFMRDAAKVCKERMLRDPTEHRFIVLALTTSGTV